VLSLNPPVTENGVAAGSYAQAIGSLAGVAGSRVELGRATLTVGGRSGITAFDGVITGAGGLVKVGASSILTLSGANAYAGGTTVSGGTLSVGADSNLGDPAGGLRFGGGTLRTTASFASARPVTLFSGGGTFDVAADTTLTWTGLIADSGGGLT